MDMELKGYILAKDPNFNWKKMPTVRELAGEAVETMVAEAQSSLDDAKKKSDMEGFEFFNFGP